MLIAVGSYSRATADKLCYVGGDDEDGPGDERGEGESAWAGDPQRRDHAMAVMAKTTADVSMPGLSSRTVAQISAATGTGRPMNPSVRSFVTL